MTRIISGRAGSLTLDVPDAGTRPTSDRVRESLFGALDASDLIRGARVLDLYAGSGALGLEAASRGAMTVDLVEKAPRAVTVIRRNAARIHAALRGSDDPARIAVHRVGVDAYLRSAPVGVFDLVFLDPPYDLSDAELRTNLQLLVPALSPEATVIVERGARSTAPAWPAGLTARRDRRYGDTTLWWASRDASQPETASQSR
ncbi:RsmD family RNA methyltransferase [Microbacterium invictum]|uniref:RsmD family RNA methyltransferase n=1 Tax=Microbacterium invictum TaxID=515415 RepID=A0ABZ0VEA2_9MICO|nr:RsmD family RNA methyltransferase [Microbacterium invictum]WQB71922.1 RsmD family RNA methyltransferase [Microbacterium invictum]